MVWLLQPAQGHMLSSKLEFRVNNSFDQVRDVMKRTHPR